MQPQTILSQGVQNTPEARRWKRVRIDVLVKFIFTRNGIKNLNFGRGDDLSEGGLGLSSRQGLEQDERVMVEFELPYAPQPVKLSGVVRFTCTSRCGVEFLSPTTIQRQQIARVCRALSQIQ